MRQLPPPVKHFCIAALAMSLAAGVYAQAAKDQNTSPATAVGDAERGAEQFEATCAECHGAAATAPTLRGIINRPMGSVASFYGYSEAMKSKQNLKWTVENLDAYLKSPATFVPGNFMYREYPDAQLRADVIAFLATLPPPK
jgi:cytochrome c